MKIPSLNVCTPKATIIIIISDSLSWRMAGERGKFGVQSDIKQRGKYFTGILFYIWAKGQMKPLKILLRTIIEKERTKNEKGIEGRRGIFGGKCIIK